MATIAWCIEKEIFTEQNSRLINAAKKLGHEVIEWDDDWLRTKAFPSISSEYIVFHGSLGNANIIKKITGWNPGAFCASESFFCSSWYPQWKKWLVHRQWMYSTVSEFVHNPAPFYEILGKNDLVFIRPDSPLKPFSGRVLSADKVSLAALDYGFYYSDRSLPIVIAPVVDIQAEYRFVIVNKKVVAGSAYDADGRKEGESINSSSPIWEYAQSVVEDAIAPEVVYVLDACEINEKYYVLELNPFSGADLYSCNREAIVEAVSNLLN